MAIRQVFAASGVLIYASKCKIFQYLIDGVCAAETNVYVYWENFVQTVQKLCKNIFLSAVETDGKKRRLRLE